MSQSIVKSAAVAAGLFVVLASGSTSYGQQVSNGVPPGGAYGTYNYAGVYPPVHAPLYPCPKPNVPYEVGRTLITNPALAPHEMLYPHTYRALYPPYYYKNTCGLACIPFFPKPKLRGTEVIVKYKSHHGLFGYQPPCSREHYHNATWR